MNYHKIIGLKGGGGNVDKPVETLKDLLLTDTLPFLPDPKQNTTDTVGRPAYGATKLFEAPPRKIVDKWFTLNNRSKPLVNQVNEIIEIVKGWLYDEIENDPSLLNEQRLKTRAAIEELLNDSRTLLQEVIHTGTMSTPSLNLNVPLSTGPRQTFEFAHYHRQRFRINAGSENTNSQAPNHHDYNASNVTRFLKDRTQGCLTLLYDLCTLRSNPTYRGRALMPNIQDYALAQVRWEFDNQRIQVPWLGPACRGFWDTERFCHSWNLGLDKYNQGQRGRKTFVGIDFLRAHWLAIGSSLLLGETMPWKRPQTDGLTQGELDALVKQVERLVDAPQYGVWRREISLRRFAAFLAPESGLPAAFVELFFQSEKLTEFWLKGAADIRQFRANLVRVSRQHETVPDDNLLLVSPQRYFNRIIPNLIETISSFISEISRSSLNSPHPNNIDNINSRLDDLMHALHQIEEDILIRNRNLNPTINRIISILSDIIPQLTRSLERIRVRSGNISLRQSLMQIEERLNHLSKYGDFGLMLLDHPINKLDSGALCPDEDEIQEEYVVWI